VNGNKYGLGKISNRWKFLIDAPFKISGQCCDIMKKNPAKKFEKETGLHPMIGVLASESAKRLQDYLKVGCNAFEAKRPMSRPLGFWTENDILEYLYKYEIPYASVYGEIGEKENEYYNTGERQTGCMFCAFGVHMEKEPNKFQRMKISHPKLWDYCINKLGLKEVLDFINVPYE
jgi:3'-phosphoadenosine 5'-phosphosulfate sulfotransferase (PAPS reductase)/FAD synthetase